MPDLSHDTAEDGFHEIQLSGKQLVFLFIVTTSVVVGVFLFGVLVGRGARESRPEETSAPAQTSTAPAEPATTPAVPPAEAPAPVSEEAQKDDLSYAERLKGAAPAEKLKSKAEEDNPTSASGAPVATPSAAAPPSTAPRAAAPQASPAAPARPAAVPSGVPQSGQPGVWAVQVVATRDQADAVRIVQRLVGKGYPAFLVNPAPGASQPFYKVQVGRYHDRGDAEKVSLRLKKEEQFKSWILR